LAWFRCGIGVGVGNLPDIGKDVGGGRRIWQVEEERRNSGTEVVVFGGRYRRAGERETGGWGLLGVGI